MMDLCKLFSSCRRNFQFALLNSMSPILLRTVPNQKLVFTREISVSGFLNNKRWRLQNGYPRRWQDRGTLTDAPDFSYVDGRPSPYTSGQRARLLIQKEYTEKIIYLLNGIKFAKQRRIDEMEKKKEEVEFALTKKLKWKGVKEPVTTEEYGSNHRKRRGRTEKIEKV